MAITVPTSGKFGTVRSGGSDLQYIRSWKAVEKAIISKFGTNIVGGYGVTVTGRLDCDGTFEMLTPPTFHAGDNVQLSLFYNSGVDLWHSFASATIGDVSVTVDVDSGKEIGWSIPFQSNGLFA